MRLDNFAKNNIIMFLANSIGSFFNLLYQLAMLRLVSKDVFASLNSLLSLLVIISVPAVAFTTMVTKHVSTHNARKDGQQLKALWQKLLLHAVCFSIAVFFLIILFRNHIAGFLQIGSLGSITFLAAIFFLSCVTAVLTGGLQGLEKFKWLAVVGISAGFLKLAFSIGLVRNFPDTLSGALFGFLLSILISIFISIWPLKFLFTPIETVGQPVRGKRPLTGLAGIAGENIVLKQHYLYILPVLAAAMSFALLTNIDMVLIKHFFKIEAQDYAVAQMIGKIILSISGMVYAVMFARVANLHALKLNSREILKRSITLAFILSLAAAALYNLFPRFIFHLLAGSVNEQVIILGRVFSISMLFYALSNVLWYYQLSIERYSFLKPLLAMALLEIIAIGLFHKTTLWVAGISTFFALLIFTLNLRSAFRAAI
jgi:O-antigen/teichoic acid export membrane protein